MRLCEAIKLLRCELGVTQQELANHLNINFTTVSRWETGKSFPNNSAAVALSRFAKESGASRECISCLQSAFDLTKKNVIKHKSGRLYSMDHESICHLVDNASIPFYVCDYESDEILYMNNKAKELTGIIDESVLSGKCYECIMHRSTPCIFCQKNEFVDTKLTGFDVFMPRDGKTYHVLSKAINWSGRKAHAHYITGETSVVESLGSMRKLSDHIPAGIGIIDVYTDGRIEQIYLNDGYYTTIGTTREKRTDFFGFNAFDALYSEDREKIRKELMSCAKAHLPFHVETRIVTDNGTFKWLSVQGNAINQTSRKSTYYCVFTDIDKLKLTQLRLEETAIRQNEKDLYLDNILHNLPCAVASFEIDAEGTHMKYISDGCFKITGYTASETIALCNKDALFLTHPEDKPFVAETAAANARERMPFSSEFRIIIKSGGVRWVSLKLSPVINGNTLQYYGIYLDITSEHETNEQQTRLVNSLPGGIIIYNIGKTIKTMYYSDGILRLSGHTKEEYEALVRDDPINGIVYEDDREEMLNKVTTSVAEGNPISMVYRIKHKNGTPVWVQLSATMMSENTDGKIYYAIFTRPTEESEIYKNIVDTSNSGIFVAELNTRKLIFANRAWKKLRKISENADLLGKSLYDIIPTDDILYSDDELAALPTDHFTESHVISSYGQYLHVWGKAIDWSGYNAYICYVSDETELWESRQQLQHLIDLIPGGISIYEVDDKTIKLSYVNNAYKNALGETSHFLGEGTLMYVYPDDRDSVLDAVNDLRNGKDFFDIHFRVPDTSGEFVWIRLIGSVVERTGKRMTVYCCYSDFDEIMKAHQELKSNRAMLDAAMKSAKVLAWRYNYETHTITDSGSLGQAFALPKVVENVPDTLIDGGFIVKESINDFRRMFNEIPTGRQVAYDINSYDKPNGKKVWYRHIYTPVYDKNGNYVESIGTSIDVTEQKEREQNYDEQIRLKRLLANNAVAVSLYNISKNEVTEIESKNENLLGIMSIGTVDDVLYQIRKNTLNKAEQKLFDPIRNHEEMIKSFNSGITHFVIRHHLKNDVRWYESTFDMISSPYTGDIETVALSIIVCLPSHQVKQLCIVA